MSATPGIGREERLAALWAEYMCNAGPSRASFYHVVGGLLNAADAMAEALDRCESNRGRFSCVEQHDCRCPKSRAQRPEDWKGEWRCVCGADDLDAALTAYRALVAPPGPRGEDAR